MGGRCGGSVFRLHVGNGKVFEVKNEKTGEMARD